MCQFIKLKQCSSCKKWKFITGFNKNTKNKDGLQGNCRICQAKLHKKWSDNHLVEKAEYHKKWHKEHKAEQAEYHRKWFRDNPEKLLEYTSKHRGFGYEPLNDYFYGSHAHHVHVEDNPAFTIHVPSFLHDTKLHPHDHNDPESMVTINAISFDWWVNEKKYRRLYGFDQTSSTNGYTNHDQTTLGSYLDYGATQKLKMTGQITFDWYLDFNTTEELKTEA